MYSLSNLPLGSDENQTTNSRGEKLLQKWGCKWPISRYAANSGGDSTRRRGTQALARHYASHLQACGLLRKSAMSGVTSGAIAQFFASPTDLIKVQIQMEGRRRLLGKAPRVHGTWHAFTTILDKGGVKGLWKGSIPNVQRAALVNLGDLTTYDSVKRFLLTHTTLTDNHFTHILCSACAGLVAATMGTPADVVKTRIMNQPIDDSGKGLIYKSSVDCLVKTVENEGLFALYKGFLPVWIRMAPWSLTFWLSFEQIRSMLGATSF
ncbi:mitochondrial uncoupling protein 4 isoform X2 [Bacillus rossius redtenbacheri]|uniref:mitochondrial uncoupling protein 4 isoform X2 n=1 Tax=Bacillus rossius redtenbacheri TaxID=93214 RepID=UPI002FDE1D2F